MTSHSRSTVNQLQQLHTTETKSLMEKQCKNPKEHNSLQNLNHQITCVFKQLHHSAEIRMTFNYVKLSHQLTLPKPRHWQRPADPAGAEQLLLDQMSKRCPCLFFSDKRCYFGGQGATMVRAKGMEGTPLSASPGCTPS